MPNDTSIPLQNLDPARAWRPCYGAPLLACPVCGAPRPFDPIASALLDHLIRIADELAQVRKQVEEVTL